MTILPCELYIAGRQPFSWGIHLQVVNILYDLCVKEQHEAGK